ncbi:hypothetical protein QNI19_25200 [Cytophagaceae bacterium DM2B3-1]|uniref:Zinc-finger domain-containing protein n=2 Tax=Xanthocytophaga TaxID=3078918 RepID=A0ABT7CR79_9BACT|nr:MULTISPECIES: hypothetical protein [Xanthocytophaga]MDJ1496260.1 hypothetical protein [Xanthocytophaga flavus]MDJ1506118.1 hypothetical protein [Xanthocytophaga agilis]
MGPLKKIQYNCRKATFLIEKKQLASLTLREKLELRIHLAGCSICRTFEKQSILINRMVKDMFTNSQHQQFTLDDDYKKQLQDKIDQQLNKN